MSDEEKEKHREHFLKLFRQWLREFFLSQHHVTEALAQFVTGGVGCAEDIVEKAFLPELEELLTKS